MQEQVYQTPIRDVNDLKQRLLGVWVTLHHRIIDNAIHLKLLWIKFKHSHLVIY